MQQPRPANITGTRLDRRPTLTRFVMRAASSALTRRRFLSGALTTAPALLLSGCSAPPSDRGVRIGFMPKLTGIPYFNACKKGAEEAANELKVVLKYNGPTSTDAAKQCEIIN